MLMKSVSISALMLASSVSLASTLFEYGEKEIDLLNAIAKCPAEFNLAMNGSTKIARASFSSPRSPNPRSTYTIIFVNRSGDGLWEAWEKTKLEIIETKNSSDRDSVSYECKLSKFQL